MSLAHLTDALWDEVAARCPAAPDRVALALSCRAGAAAARRALRHAALTLDELPALVAAAAAGRLPGLARLVVGVGWDEMSLKAARSLSALTGLTELCAAGADIKPQARVVQQLITTLGALPRLCAVSLAIPDFSGSVARAVAGLTRLQRLELRCDDKAKSLRDADTAALAALTGLTSLALPHHKLTSADLGPLLAGMTRLEALDISGNKDIRLTDPPASDALAALPRLRSLAAEHCEFLAGGGASLLTRLTQLDRVTLDATGIEDDLMAALARLPALRGARLESLLVEHGTLYPLAEAAAGRLRALDVGGVDEQEAFDSIMCFTGLTRLRCSYGRCDWRVRDAGAATLGRALTGLVDLALTKCDIAMPGAAALAASLTRLTRLNLDRNPLGDAGAAALAAHAGGLLELHCQKASIGDAGAAAIAAGLTALTRLDFRGNPVGAAGAAALAGMRALRCLSLGQATGPSIPASVVDPGLDNRLWELIRAHLLPQPHCF